MTGSLAEGGVGGGARVARRPVDKQMQRRSETARCTNTEEEKEKGLSLFLFFFGPRLC